MKWFKRTATCTTCGVEFRKHKPATPSLVGFSYCTASCEALAWDAWIKGVKA